MRYALRVLGIMVPTPLGGATALVVALAVALLLHEQLAPLHRFQWTFQTRGQERHDCFFSADGKSLLVRVFPALGNRKEDNDLHEFDLADGIHRRLWPAKAVDAHTSLTLQLCKVSRLPVTTADGKLSISSGRNTIIITDSVDRTATEIHAPRGTALKPQLGISHVDAESEIGLSFIEGEHLFGISPNGETFVTLASPKPATMILTAYDVPPRKPWSYIIGVSLVVFILIVLLFNARSWVRNRKAFEAIHSEIEAQG